MKKAFWGKIFMGILVLNLLLLVYVAFIKTDAVSLETMKVGGRANMQLVEKLYKSDAYKNQQKQAIQQVLDGMGTAGDTTAPTADDTTATTTDGTKVDTATIAKLKKGAYVE